MGFPSHGQVCEDRHAAWNSKAGAMHRAMIHQVIDSSLMPGDVCHKNVEKISALESLQEKSIHGRSPFEVFFWFASVLYPRERFALRLQARMSSTCLSSSQEKVVSCCGRLVHLFQSPFPLLRSCMMLRGGVHARGRDWETEATGRIWHDLTLVARKPTSSCDRISSAEISGSHWSHACVCLHSAYLEAQSRRDFRTWMVCCWLGFFKKKKADTNMQHYVVCGLELWIPRNLPIVIPETSNIFGGTIIFGCTFNMYCWLQPHHCCLFRPM